ncbi:MAG: thioester dehydrase [Myxococcaceae bacterium]|nr:thioester dehydrase [Myxococcaceae bacterium]
MSFPPIEQVLPHRAPMLWIDSVVAQQRDDVHCRLTVRPSHVFVVDGQVDPVVSIEWMAQTVGALVGLWDRRRSEVPRPGYLIAVPEAEFMVESFQVGDVLDLHAHKTWGDATLASFEAQVDRAGLLAARAQLSVYRRKLPHEASGAQP